MRVDVSFISEGGTCRGWLYVPDGHAEGQRVPGIVLANAISAVKEITLPGYAERFAAAGYAALVFDYRHFGASDGEPREHLDPHAQQQDVRNATTWLRARSEVDPDRVGVWGISLGGVHALASGAYDRRLKAVVAVATGLNATERFMGREALQGLVAMVNADRDRRFATGEPATYIPAVARPGEQGVMAFDEAYDLYTGAMRTYAPSYANRLTLESIEWLNADRSAEVIGFISPTPLLMIHAERDVIPVDMARAYFERAGDPKKLLVLDCLHTDLYVREPWVTTSAETSIAWFDEHL